MAGMQEKDMSKRDADAREKKANEAQASKGGALSKAAAGTGRSIAGGLGAMRDVRKATKARQGAQADLKAIRQGLAEDQEMLAHREDVRRNYKRIVATQTGIIEAAQEESDKAAKAIKSQQAELERLQDELRSMRERHEQELRPYRNLMDSSRGRSDDAAKALAASRRSVRSAESAVSDATKRREQRITNAHRSVDNARGRLSAVQTEMDSLSSNGGGSEASEAALARVRAELVSEQSHLETAQADVVQITQETQGAVDQAQNTLWALQRELATAEKAAEAAKLEASSHKDEYDRRYKAAQAEERSKSDAIKACETRINSLKKTREAAEARARDAQVILDEAHDIHAHPETTEGLRQRIANEERDLEDANADLDELSAQERELRRSTRKTRVIFVVVCVAVLALLTLILWFAFARG